MRFSSTKGFTLVEVLIIAPVVIIAISGFIALMVTMTADILVTRDQNNMTYETQDALDLIEQDTRLSTQFLVTTQALPSPQGSNNNFTGTAAFTNSSSTLIMGGLTTDKNPADTTREIVYYAGQPYLCGSQQAYNRVFLSKIVYFLKDGSLWRRVVLPDYNTNVTLDDNTLCSTPWQRNTCSPGYSPSTRCQTNDSRIMDNVKTFSIKYYDDPDSTTEIASGNALSAVSIEVNLEGEKTTAGKTITNSGKLRAKKLNNIDVEIPAPSAPDVSSQTDGNTVTFTWPKVPLASSYLVTHNVNGGTPINATLNSQTTSYNVTAGRGDTITFQIQARNSTGTSPTTTVAVTIPKWYSGNVLSSTAGWADYGSGYAGIGYAKTNNDIVVLKGLIRAGTTAAGTVVGTLPTGYRPSSDLTFITSTSGGTEGTPARLDIRTNGEIAIQAIAANTWLSLDTIRFVASTASYTKNNLSLSNGWVAWGVPYTTVQSMVDNVGRVHLQGLLKNGTWTDWTTAAVMPTGQRPDRIMTFPTTSNTPFNQFSLTGTGIGVVAARGINGSGYWSIQSMHYPSGVGSWTPFTPGSSWVAYDSAAFTTPAYTKASDGIVSLKGTLKSGTTTAGTVITTLPPGYRPSERLVFTTDSAGAWSRIDIFANGQVVIRLAYSSFLSLDNISFLADQ
jgi:hypothetical protein